ncbi:MAG: hypothetical protein IH805_01280, partial [Proteobacteria bacterium]|nr:hypothetical protein [Pseudomonadota bacterium]
PAQDHKQVGEGDTGPNTGGMGAYTPTPLVDEPLMAFIQREVLVAAVDALRRDGVEYKGVLYAGLMLTTGGPMVIEFNCRFGDPETQVVLPLMDSSLPELLATVAEGGSLGGHRATHGTGAAVATVVASGGYPGGYEKGKPIRIPAGLESDELVVTFAVGHLFELRPPEGSVSTYREYVDLEWARRWPAW